MNSVNIGLILSIINAALQLAPLGLATIAGVKELLAKDPTVAEGLQSILDGTIAADDATIEMARQWKASLPPEEV
jgi:hypothetical protein